MPIALRCVKSVNLLNHRCPLVNWKTKCLICKQHTWKFFILALWKYKTCLFIYHAFPCRSKLECLFLQSSPSNNHCLLMDGLHESLRNFCTLPSGEIRKYQITLFFTKKVLKHVFHEIKSYVWTHSSYTKSLNKIIQRYDVLITQSTLSCGKNDG